MLLSFYLIFYQFQPGVANESVAYKKGVYIKKLKTEVWNNVKISKFLLDLKFPFIALKCDNYLKALMYNNFKITKEATVTKSTIS